MRSRNGLLGSGVVLMPVAAGVLGFSASAFAETATFSYTGHQQEFVVPAGVTTVGVTAIGGAGGTEGDDVARGGLGAVVSGDVSVLPGETLYVEVGGLGSLESAGFNGGGYAGTGSDEGYAGGGGGGASDVRSVPTAEAGSLASRLIVAAGGGGAGYGGPCAYEGGGRGGNAGAPGGEAPCFFAAARWCRHLHRRRRRRQI